MSTLVPALLGGLMGLGVMRLRLIWTRRDHRPPSSSPGSLSGSVIVHRRVLLRMVVAAVLVIVVGTITGWLALALTAGVLGWWAPTTWAARGRARREQAVVEAVATWAEQLRDTLSAASGLEQAVAATAAMATGPLAPALHRLAEGLRHEALSPTVRRFAVEVRHPSADFVAAALMTAAEHQARDVGALLGHLAASARDEARLRRRVWVGRARTRAATRLIAGVVVVVVGGLRVLNPEYLDAYAQGTGQVVLAGIIATFAGAFVTMERLSRIGLPERFSLRVPGRGVPR